MRRGTRSILIFLLVATAALAVALLLDPLAYRALYDPRIYDRDWGRLLRVMGYLPFWLLAAGALALHDRAPSAGAGPLRGDVAPAGAGASRASGGRWFSRALLLALSPILSGIAGELLKLVVRRERPWAHGGASVFRAWSDHPFSSAGLSTPSSHSVVAFGAAFMLARLFPRAWPVWYLLAGGCALTRVAARAHFLSDVALGALVAWLVVAALWRRARPVSPLERG